MTGDKKLQVATATLALRPFEKRLVELRVIIGRSFPGHFASCLETLSTFSCNQVAAEGPEEQAGKKTLFESVPAEYARLGHLGQCLGVQVCKVLRYQRERKSRAQ
jgi:hypothetical protein